MRVTPVILLGVMLAAPPSVGWTADRLQLKNLRATVEIIPEDRPDVTVSVDMTGSRDAAPQIRTVGDTVTVEGRNATEVKTYRVSLNLDRNLDVEGMKRRSHLQRDPPPGLPGLVIHMPLKVRVSSNGYVFGHIGPSETLTIRDDGDGAWRIDTVQKAAAVQGHGAADFTLGETGSANIDLLGTGNVTLGDTQTLWSSQWGSGDVIARGVLHDTDIEISGIGDFSAATVSGKMRILISDAGNVTVEDGDLAILRVRTIDGLGSVRFGGVVKDADINIGTATKVRIHKVTGAVKKTLRQAASLEIETP